MACWVTSCQPEVPRTSPAAALSPSTPEIVRMRRRTISCNAVTQPLLAVDAPALLYRAFHALPDSITDGDGRPVNALLGSVNQILWCVERYDPRAVVLCFGAEGAAYRIEAYPPYHAQRPEMPEGLADQWQRAPGFYEALGWAVMDADDLE